MSRSKFISGTVTFLKAPADTAGDQDCGEKVLDDRVWLEVTDIAFPDDSGNQEPSKLRVSARFSDTKNDIKNLLDGMSPIPPGTVRVYDHLVESPSGSENPAESGERLNRRPASTVRNDVREHLSAATNAALQHWDDWDLDNVSPVVGLQQNYLVRDQWSPRSHSPAASRPLEIGTYISDHERSSCFYRTLLQCFPVEGDSLIVLHLHEPATDFCHRTSRTASSPEVSGHTPGLISLARQILQSHIISHIAGNNNGQAIQLIILECLRQRLFLATESWADWLKDNVRLEKVDMTLADDLSAPYLMELRQVFLRLSTSVEQLVDCMDFVMTSAETENEWLSHCLLRLDLADLRSQCKRASSFVKFLNNILQENWDLRQAAVDIKRAETTARLTLLAVIFLPLSLSSSVLAMQTRFRNINELFYDFIGTAFVFSGIAFILYFAVLVVRLLIGTGEESRTGPAVTKTVVLRYTAVGMRKAFAFGYLCVTAGLVYGMISDDFDAGFMVMGIPIAGTAVLIAVLQQIELRGPGIFTWLRSLVTRHKYSKVTPQPAP